MPSAVVRVFSHTKHRGIQVLLVVALYLLFARVLPLDVHRGFYTVSVWIKDILLWFLPFTVGAFIAHTTCSFERRAPAFIITLLVFEALSNLASVWYAYGVRPPCSMHSAHCHGVLGPLFYGAPKLSVRSTPLVDSRKGRRGRTHHWDHRSAGRL